MGNYPFTAPDTTYIVYLAPSGDTTGVTDAANIRTAVSGLPASGGVINLAATGTWYIECGQIVINKSGVYINALGCFIYATGTGDMIRMYDSSVLDETRLIWGGGILGMPNINGSLATGTTSAFHAGDIPQLAVFAKVTTFSKGIWFDNNYYWTEQAYGRIVAQNCATGVQFDNSNYPDGTGSFDRLDMDIYLDQNGAGNGVVFTNGAAAIDYRLGIYGNFLYSSEAVYYVLVLDSNVPSGSYLSGSSILNIGIEVDGSGTYQPATLNFESVSGYSYIVGEGFLNFLGFAESNAESGNMTFTGPIYGDPTLLSAPNLALPGVAQMINGNGQEILTQSFATCLLTLSGGSYTGAVMESASSAIDGARFTVINLSALYSLTFAAAGTSNVADGVLDTITPLTAATYIWSAAQSLWYRSV